MGSRSEPNAAQAKPSRPEDAYADMENRELHGDNHRNVQRDADEAVASFVLRPALLGIIAGGVIGALIGLIFAVVPTWGLNIWAGIIIGSVIGMVAGAMIGARLVLDRAGEPAETFHEPGAPARNAGSGDGSR
jgi:hypothetical protein